MEVQDGPRMPFATAQFAPLAADFYDQDLDKRTIQPLQGEASQLCLLVYYPGEYSYL
jgi:hypothetical protein